VDKDELEGHPGEVTEAGAPGGVFIVMPEGGITYDIGQ